MSNEELKGIEELSKEISENLEKLKDDKGYKKRLVSILERIANSLEESIEEPSYNTGLTQVEFDKEEEEIIKEKSKEWGLNKPQTLKRIVREFKE